MNLYVGNLAPDIQEEDLRSAFGEFGEVTDAKVVRTGPSGPSRGFGFVRFAKREDALLAVSKMSGVELNGQALTVNPARKGRDDRRRRDRRRSRGKRGNQHKGRYKGKNRRRESRRRDGERRKGRVSIGLTRSEEDRLS